MFDVIVVGDACWDVVVRPCRPFGFNRDVLARVHGGPGGQGLNMAVAARATGARVALVTGIGQDAESRLIEQYLDRQAIALPALDRSGPLTRVVSVVNADGERALMTDAGPGPTITGGDGLDGSAGGCLLLSGYLAGRDGGRKRLDLWVQWGRQHGMTVLLDPGHRDMWTAGDRFPRVDWVLANEAEWAALGDGVEADGRVIKRGPAGVRVVTDEGVEDVPAAPVGNVMDTTGAGDAVAGAFAGWLSQGIPPRMAARRAVARAALTCRHLGAVPYPPDDPDFT